MKTISQYILPLLVGFYFFGCGKPGPTELVDDRPNEETPLQYEVLAKNPEDALYQNGYDSTGLAAPPPLTDVFTFVSKNQISEKNGTVGFDVAEVLFLDRNNPFVSMDGKHFGYHSKKVFPPMINSLITREENNHIEYGHLASAHDTTLGPKYVLNRSGKTGDSLWLAYNAPVKFEYREKMMDPKISFSVMMPEQIIGHISLSTDPKGEKVIHLEWNPGTKDSVEIIVGGKMKNEKTALAFFKFRVKDNGRVKIPTGFVSSIPKDRFDRLVIMFVRKAVSRRMESSLEFFTVVQNTHSIVIDYP